MRKSLTRALMLVALSLPVIPQEVSGAAPAVSVVISGLDNPRGLALGPEGALYVVEAGRGGNGACTVRLNQSFCYGPTGAVRRLSDGKVELVATGLPSIARPNGNRAQGADGISFNGRGELFVSIGWEADPLERSQLGDSGLQFAQLIRIMPNGQWHSVADLGTYEAESHPVDPDTDPFNVLAEAGSELVVDSGANRLVRVRGNGEIPVVARFPRRDDGRFADDGDRFPRARVGPDMSVVATFPSREDGRSTDSVPTSVVVGPDRAYYVSELTGVPFNDGAANIYRIVPGHEPAVFLSGFKTIIDIAFNSQGNLYVLEHSSGVSGIGDPGKLKRVELHGCTGYPDTCTRTELMSGIDRPTSIAIGPHDEIYMSVHGISAGVGEVWRIDP